MNNDLDYSLKQRKEFLHSDDFDKLMKDFKDNKDKSSVKIVKPKEINQPCSLEQEYKPSPLGKPNSKKKKDIISLDLPMMGMIKPAPSQPEKESIFGKIFSRMPKDYYDKEVIDNETGLPKAFSITNEMTKDIASQSHDNAIETKPQINQIKTNDHNLNEEVGRLSEIERENKDKISKMSIKEIEDYQKEIEVKLPTSFISKLKSGKYREKLHRELLKLDKVKELPINTEKGTSDIISTTNAIAKDNTTTTTSLNKLSQDKLCQMPYYNYLGNKTIKEVTETLSLKESSDKIDFTHNTFNEMELNNKYYSLLEIYNFLCSSNENQVIFGLKILFKLIPNEIENENELVKQLYSFINGLFYLIEHRNMNIKHQSVLILSKILDYLFKEDINAFLKLSLHYCLFPAIVIDSLPTKNHLQNDLKERIVQLIMNNSSKDFIRMIDYKMNTVIKEHFCNIAIYFYYICGYEKINKDLNRIVNNATMINNGTLMILCLMNSDVKHLDILKTICYDNAKDDQIKLIYLFICLIKGVNTHIPSFEINKILQKPYESIDLNIIRMNCLFKLGENIPSHLFFGQTDYALSSHSLLALIKYSATHDYCSMLDNKSQLQFYIELYHSSFNHLCSSSDHSTKLPIYSYWNSILTLYIKSFQYPKIVNYYKTISLADILSLFPILSKILDDIIDSINKNTRITKDKAMKAQYLYQYEIFLTTCLNFIRCFIKRYEPEYNELRLSRFFIQLSQLINVNCEYYYLKFIKYFKIYFYKKYSSIKGEQQFPFISYNKIDEDLNFYLNSNEDLRQSTLYKRLMWIQSDDMLSTSIIASEKDIQHRASKYFPFDNNFLFQVLYNKDAQSMMKLNYLVIVIILFHDEKSTDNDNWFREGLFELYIRALISFRTSDLVTIDYSNTVFEKYILLLLFNEAGNDNPIVYPFSLKSSENNQLVLENFFSAFDVIDSIEQLNIFYKSVVLMLIFVHSHMNINGNGKIKAYHYSKNLSDVIYQHYHYLLLNECSLSYLSDRESTLRQKIIAFLIKNAHINNIDLYETIIMNSLRYNQYNKEIKSFSIIADYSLELITLFSIDQKDYSKYVNDTTELRKILTEKCYHY